MPDPSVSYHATLRWLERIRDIDVRAYARDLAALDDCDVKEISDCDLMHWILAACNFTVDQIHAEILTPAVIAAHYAGAKRVKTSEAIICFKDHGVIATIYKKKGAKNFKKKRSKHVQKGMRI